MLNASVWIPRTSASEPSTARAIARRSECRSAAVDVSVALDVGVGLGEGEAAKALIAPMLSMPAATAPMVLTAIPGKRLIVITSTKSVRRD